jgi:hypothetical protein
MVPELLYAALGILLVPLLTLLAVRALSHDPRPGRLRRHRG